MKKFIWMVFVLFAFMGNSFAQVPPGNVADIKTQLISSMEKDGYLSKKMAAEVAQKYITAEDKKAVEQKVASKTDSPKEAKSTAASWSDYLSWINFIKVVGVIFFLVAFSGVISKIIAGLWMFIVAVPVEFYQTVFLSMTMLGIFRPDLIWESQYFYVALFSSFANIMVLAWVVDSHKKLQEILSKLFNLGIPVQCVASFYGMLYFGALAFAYHSTIFGFFAAVCLSGVFSFSLYYVPGTLFLDFKENMINQVVFGHMLVLGAYIAVFKEYAQYTELFNAGIQYYCTIALSVGLLVAASPFYKRESAIGYGMIFIALFGLASYGYFFSEFKVMSSIIFVFFTLFVLEWIGYIGYLSGMILGSALIGGSLYALSLLLEQYGSMIILTLH